MEMVTASTRSRGRGAPNVRPGARRALLNAVRELLQTVHERGPEFERLANALSALYPKESEEKRLLDAMLLAVPR